MAHAFSNILVHLIFSTKHRRRNIKPLFKSELYRYMSGIFQKLDCYPILINGASDHVHSLFALSPIQALADVIRTLKSNSSKWVHETHPGFSGFGWQEGFAAFSARRFPALTHRANLYRPCRGWFDVEHNRQNDF